MPSATSETTTAETPSTCSVSYSLAPCCLADFLPIEAAPSLPSTAGSCSAMPSVFRPRTSSLLRIFRASARLVIRTFPVARSACTSKASWQIDLERVGLPAEKSDLDVIFVRVFLLRGWRACADIGSSLFFALHRGVASDSWSPGCFARLVFRLVFVFARIR